MAEKYSDMDPKKKIEYRESLKETIDILTLQAKIAEERAKLQKFAYEELTYFIQLDRMKNPEKYKEDDQPDIPHTNKEKGE